MIDIFIGAVIFSIWCVTLFFGKGIGLSMFLFIVPITYFIIHLLEKNRKQINSKAKILIIPIILLASTYFIFNNSFFNTINIFAIPVLVIFMILESFKENIELNLGLISKILEMFFVPLSFIGETFEKLRQSLEGKFKINIDSNKDRKIKKVIEAICITLPIVLVIIVLLSSADEIFGSIFTELLKSILNGLSKIQLSTTIIRLFLIICAFIYFLCFFDYISSRYEKDEESEITKSKAKDNFTIKMILGALNIVYLLFCIIQVKSLFMRNVNINYAHYARQGFFQLMWVSVINLVTILIAKKSENKDEENRNKYINSMCLIMIIFTFIILLSSALRMYFYESVYGYTLLRLLVYCSLFTEAVLLVPTILYIMDKKINLAKSYFTIILTIYICMNFANFDNIIAKRNVDRYIETGKIDINYLKTETGTDAINQIMRILETSTDIENVKLDTEKYLNTVYAELNEQNMDFRDFNISKIFAKHLIEKRLQ